MAKLPPVEYCQSPRVGRLQGHLPLCESLCNVARFCIPIVAVYPALLHAQLVVRRSSGHVLTLTGRHSLRSGARSHGSARLDWAFPIAGGLNGHVQAFSGYGQNLIDYNHRQTTVGFGVSFFD